VDFYPRDPVVVFYFTHSIQARKDPKSASKVTAGAEEWS
jgi:hypothetical protein